MYFFFNREFFKFFLHFLFFIDGFLSGASPSLTVLHLTTYMHTALVKYPQYQVYFIFAGEDINHDEILQKPGRPLPCPYLPTYLPSYLPTRLMGN